METINDTIGRFKIEKQFSWLMMVVLLISGLPFFKNAVVFVLEKLYELFINYGIGK